MDTTKTDLDELGSLPNQTENKKYMDRKFYNAAVEGKIVIIKEKRADELEDLLTPRRNTILHIHISARAEKKEPTQFLKEVLDMCRPSLVFQANSKGDTPLHLAARYGHDGVVKELIERANSLNQLESGYKQMLWVTNNEKDTAFHEAVRMNHIDVVRLLIDEDPEYSYSANVAGETPLYLAVERGYKDIAFEILGRCTSPAHGGPNGRTTLHAAVINKDKEITRSILEETEVCTLTSEVDDEGLTALHHSAHNGSFTIFIMLLEKDKSAAYIASKDKQWTPLHIAIRSGCLKTTKDLKTIKELISQCPDCGELVDHQGWNVLHHAIDVKKGDVFTILSRDRVLKKLLNEKDQQGNTPLHLYAATFGTLRSKVFTHPVVDINALNNINQTAMDLVLENKLEITRIWSEAFLMNGFKRSIRNKILPEIAYKYEILGDAEETGKVVERREKAREAHLVVATLIATVTFAAGFTLPGGYISDNGPNQGMAILSRKTAFHVFIISDTIAFVLSICSVHVHVLMALKLNSARDFLRLFPLALIFTTYAMEAMVIAFAIGKYAVLGNSQTLAISCVTITIFFFICIFLINCRYIMTYL